MSTEEQQAGGKFPDPGRMAPSGTSEPLFKYSELPFPKWAPILAGALVGVLIRLVFSGWILNAMSGGFIYFAPGIVGAVTVFLAERKQRRTWNYYIAASIAANALFVLGTMVILIEGAICAVIILPLFIVLGAIGGVLMGALCRFTNWPRKGLYSASILLLVLGSLDPSIAARDETGEVRRSVLVDRDASIVWKHLLNVPSVEAKDVDRAWLFRIGVPLPKSGLIQGRGGRPVRRVTMGKSVYFDEVITERDEPRNLKWTYRYYPDSFPPHALDEHVVLGGQYFDIRDTAYELEPSGRQTRLTVTMRYRVTTRFNWYAFPVARWLLGNLAEVNVDYYRRQAESDPR